MRLRGRWAWITVLAATLLTAAASVPDEDVSLAIGQDPGSICVGGWATAGSPSVVAGSTAVDVTVQGATQWVAGAQNEEGPSFAAYTARSSSQSWSIVPAARMPSGSLLTGIAVSGPQGLWASGERVRTGGQTQPLIEHFDGAAWSASRVPTLRYGGALSDITQVNPRLALAVGFGADLAGQHAVAYAWHRDGWSLASPDISGFSALTGVSAAPDGTTWAVGWIQTTAGFRPLLERWNGSGWTRASIAGDGSVVLTGVDSLSKHGAWASGFREVGGAVSGIVAHWDGRAWAVDPGLSIAATGGSILRSVAVVDGRVTAVGESWEQTGGYKDSLPVVAELDGSTWTSSAGVAGITGGELLSVTGGPHALAVGRTSGHAIAIVPCTPGHAPSANGAPIAGAGGSSAVADGSSTIPGAPARPHRKRPPRTIHTALPAPRTIPKLQVEDVTARAGLTLDTLAFNGTAADLNGDGWPDMVISRRARPLWVLLNQANGTFQAVDNPFRQADRHGCAVGGLEIPASLGTPGASGAPAGTGVPLSSASPTAPGGPAASGTPGSAPAEPLPAIVCAVGASHGLGIKDNEVWLDPLDATATNAADVLGLADPLGRGRETALLDYNHDGLLDVYFGNDPSRPDALPGSNHLFRNVDGSSFVPAPEAGLDLGVGSQCLIPVDLDGDGWTDLINCEHIPMAGYSALHIFHNDHGVFRDVTAQLGVDGAGIDAAASGDLNDDGRMDLVTLSPGRMDVWLQSGGTFHDGLVMSVSDAVAVTLADVNGDGRLDIYLVGGERRGKPVQDVLLLYDGKGTRFTSVRLPSLQAGPGGAAFPIDYDRNGKQDLLVMHGNNVAPGPIQLLAFGPPWPFGVPGQAAPMPSPPLAPGPSPSSSPAVSEAPS